MGDGTSYMAEPAGSKRTLHFGQMIRSLNESLQLGQTLGMARLILSHDREEQPLRAAKREPLEVQ
jgi:hypothetical protein